MFFRRLLGAVGRIFISAIFIISALNKIFGWDEVLDGLTSNLNEWLLYVGTFPWIEEVIELMIEYAPALLTVATAFELLGAVSLVLGIRPRFGATLLVLFLIPVTIFYHHFWFLYGEERNLQLIMFLKNCAILGGLLNIIAVGRSIKRSEILDAISRSST